MALDILEDKLEDAIEGGKSEAAKEAIETFMSPTSRGKTAFGTLFLRHICLWASAPLASPQSLQTPVHVNRAWGQSAHFAKPLHQPE